MKEQVIIDGPGQYLTVEGRLVEITRPYVTRKPSPWDWEGVIYIRHLGYVPNVWNSNGAFFYNLGKSEHDIMCKVV